MISVSDSIYTSIRTLNPFQLMTNSAKLIQKFDYKIQHELKNFQDKKKRKEKENEDQFKNTL